MTIIFFYKNNSHSRDLQTHLKAIRKAAFQARHAVIMRKKAFKGQRAIFQGEAADGRCASEDFL